MVSLTKEFMMMRLIVTKEHTVQLPATVFFPVAAVKHSYLRMPGFYYMRKAQMRQDS